MGSAPSGRGDFSCALADWDSVRPRAASHLPLQPHFLEHVHTPLPTTCHMMLSISSTDQSFLPPGFCTGCCLNRNTPHPLLDLEDARLSAVPCSCYLEAFQVTAGRVSCFLPWSPTDPLGYPLCAIEYRPHWAAIGFTICSPVPQLTGNCLEAGVSSALLCGLNTEHRAWHKGETLSNVRASFPGRRDNSVCPGALPITGHVRTKGQRWGKFYSFTFQETEAHGGIGICPSFHSTSVTKLGLLMLGPKLWALAALHSVLALSQGVWRPLGPRPCSCPGHTGSAVLAGLSANCSTRFWMPLPKVTVSSLGRWPGHFSLSGADTARPGAVSPLDSGLWGWPSSWTVSLPT